RFSHAAQQHLAARLDDGPRPADHARNRSDCRGAADLSGAARLGEPLADRERSRLVADSAHPQLLGRLPGADRRRVSVRLPSHPLLHHRDRPGAPARGGDARRRSRTAVPARLPAAPRARARNHLLPLFRPGFLGFPVRGPAGRPRRTDASHRYRRLHRCLRGVRLLDGLGDCDDHGSGTADHRRRRACPARRVLPWPCRRSKRMSAAESSVLRRSLGDRLWATAMVVLIAFFIVNVFGVIASVTVSSFGRRWLGTWLPSGWTTRWYSAAWAEFQLDDVL